MDSIIFMDKFRLNLRDIAFLKLKNTYNYCLAFLKKKNESTNILNQITDHLCCEIIVLHILFKFILI